jgi:hypothetical protein
VICDDGVEFGLIVGILGREVVYPRTMSSRDRARAGGELNTSCQRSKLNTLGMEWLKLLIPLDDGGAGLICLSLTGGPGPTIENQ